MIYELTDHEWEQIKKYLPESNTGRKAKNLLRTLSCIKWILKNGGSWRSLPEYFGNGNSVHRYFCRLQEKSMDSTFISVQRAALGAKKR